VPGVVYHHADHLTGANVDTDGSGAMVSLIDYYPYGDTWVEEETTDYENDYKFTGKERDEEIGLYYYEQRYYDSSLSRFASVDPWGGDMADPQSFNKYSYTLNNPVKYVDPDGRNPLAIVSAAITAYVAVNEGFGSAAEVAPGTGDMNDVYVATTGRSLYTGESVSGVERYAGAVASALPVVTGGVIKAGIEHISPLLKKEADFFDGAIYSPKILNEMKQNDYHGFPLEVDNFQDAGFTQSIKPRDPNNTNTFTELNIPGFYMGKDGNFNYIKDQDGLINHRKFEPNND
jgi:RHS repeat-associated protein